LKKIIIPLILLTYCYAFSQQTTVTKYSVKKSTLTTLGTANSYLSQNKIKVLQSAGQSSIIGYKKVGSTGVQQGFLNSTIYLKLDNSKNTFIREKLSFVISPNPFIDFIQINFSKKTAFNIHIKVFDVNGRIYINNTFEATDKIILPLNRFSIGTYLIQIKSGKSSSTTKILKIE
jgi:hypothetical protein